MSRFARVDGDPVYSELKPERCLLHETLKPAQAAERRRIFMEEIPLPDELGDSDLYSQSRRRSR